MNTIKQNQYQNNTTDLVNQKIEFTIKTKESFCGRHKVVILTVAVVGVIAAVALAAMFWPASFSVLGAWLISHKIVLLAVPEAAKIIVVAVAGIVSLATGVFGAVQHKGTETIRADMAKNTHLGDSQTPQQLDNGLSRDLVEGGADIRINGKEFKESGKEMSTEEFARFQGCIIENIPDLSARKQVQRYASQIGGQTALNLLVAWISEQNTLEFQWLYSVKNFKIDIVTKDLLVKGEYTVEFKNKETDEKLRVDYRCQIDVKKNEFSAPTDILSPEQLEKLREKPVETTQFARLPLKKKMETTNSLQNTPGKGLRKSDCNANDGLQTGQDSRKEVDQTEWIRSSLESGCRDQI